MQSVRFSSNSATLPELACLLGDSANYNAQNNAQILLVEDDNHKIFGQVSPVQVLDAIHTWSGDRSTTVQDLIIQPAKFELVNQIPEPFKFLSLYQHDQIEYLILPGSDRSNWKIYGLEHILDAFQKSVILRKQIIGDLVQPLPLVEYVAEAIAQWQTLDLDCVIFALDSQTYASITPVQLLHIWQTHDQPLGEKFAGLRLRELFDPSLLPPSLVGIDPTETAAYAVREMQRCRRNHLVITRAEQILGILHQKSLVGLFASQNMYHTLEQLDQELNDTLSQKAQLLLSCIERDQGFSDISNQASQFQLEQEYKISLATLKIRQAFSLEEIEEATVTEVAKWLNCDRVLLCQFVEEDTEQLVAEAVTDPEWAILNRPLSTKFTETGWLEFYQRGIARVIDQVSELPELHFLAELDVKSSLAVAIPYGKKLWGLLIAHQCLEPRTWEPAEIDFVERLAPRLAINFHQAKLLSNSLTEFEERRQVERKLIHHTFHDLLTDLPNRLMLLERLEAILRSSGAGFAVVMLDLDRFRLINDGLGHLVGDRLLQELVTRLSQIPRIDLIARIGGDEFVLLLENLPEVAADRTIAQAIVEQVQQCLSEPFPLPEQGESHSITLSASMGVVISNSELDYLSPAEILRDADASLNIARRQGVPYMLFQPCMREGLLSRLTLEHDLRLALKQQDFRLYYQPIIQPQTGYLLGFEALLRWSHPLRGMVYPGEFIPVIEETGLIVPIGDWVIRTACQQLRQWQEQYPRTSLLWMSVNVSNIQLEQPSFVDQVLSILAETRIVPNCLHLEITESVLTQDFSETYQKLEQLRSQGIEILIDDFGTGYSSFSYLQNLPVDGLKIDRSFISRIVEDQSSYEIVQAIMNLTRSLGKTVVVEGVETLEQLNRFLTLGDHPTQGYYYSPPVASDLASEMVNRGYLKDGDRA